MYILIRLIKSPNFIAVPCSTEVIDGLQHMLSAAKALGGGISRSRRVKVYKFSDAAAYNKMGRSRIATILPEGKSTVMQAMIYADAKQERLVIQTMIEDESGVDRRGPASLMLDDSDLAMLYAHALRQDRMDERRERKKEEAQHDDGGDMIEAYEDKTT